VTLAGATIRAIVATNARGMAIASAIVMTMPVRIWVAAFRGSRCVSYQ
jgi:hypothetical protein